MVIFRLPKLRIIEQSIVLSHPIAQTFHILERRVKLANYPDRSNAGWKAHLA
jgi:hypothetical protein